MDCCRNKTPWYRKLLGIILGRASIRFEAAERTALEASIALVGCPNVGKSVLFNALTGMYVTVSNYPGTTVEVSRGRGRIGNVEFQIVDTPGMYSLSCITDEEKVTRDLLIGERPELILHVVDAKNLERMLPLTLQLIEAGLPVMLVLNIMDEAEELGLSFDIPGLERSLGIPVLAAAAGRKVGLENLRKRIIEYACAA